VGLLFFSEALRQLGDIRRDPPRPDDRNCAESILFVW
jgi:hypothetical protein